MASLPGMRHFLTKEGEHAERMLERNRKRIARKMRRIARDERALREEIDNTEADLGRTLLLAMTINRLLVRKRAVSSGEIAQVAKSVDLWDGVKDRKLDPAVFRPEEEEQARRPVEPAEFLHRLEDRKVDPVVFRPEEEEQTRPAVEPEEFLRRLEDEK